MNTRYEVQTLTVCEGWINCWTLTDCRGHESLQTFRSKGKAEDALNEHLQDMIDEGMTILDVATLAEDYRIERAE